MSTISCPGCGGQFPLEAVAAYASFQCSQCGGTVLVPQAQPQRPAQRQAQRQTQPPAGRPAARPPAQRAAQPAQQRATKRTASRVAARSQGVDARGSRRQREEPDEPQERDGPPLALIVGGAIVLIGAVAAFFALRGDEEPPPLTEEQAAAPERDDSPAGWKLLSETERRDIIATHVTRADTGSESEVQASVAYFTARKADDTARQLAHIYLQREPRSEWANEAVGRQEVVARIKRVLAECEIADDVETDAVRMLRRTIHGRKERWAEGAELERVEEQIAQVRRDEAELAKDANYARAKWVTWQRKIEVMKEYPTVHAAVGPYLIFVQVTAERGTPIEKADPAAIKIAREILDRNVKLFGALYEGWTKEMSGRLGFKVYDEGSVDENTLLKVNVFASHEDYAKYNIAIGAYGTLSARAYYSLEEPRFICTYQGGKDEKQDYTNQVQSHEATHQLVHFYTWDLTRKTLGRTPRWLDALHRPLWSSEGFAEFFSAHVVKDGKYTWMQPLEERMQHIWIFDQILEKKGWKPWPLEQILKIRHGGELQTQGSVRGGPGEEGIAGMVMVNLFYADAWSLVYFLWHKEEGGQPKYRDRLLDYWKTEFELDYGQHDNRERESPRLIVDRDFWRAFELPDEESRRAFEDEWQAFERELVEKHRKPEWEEERKKIFKRTKIKD